MSVKDTDLDKFGFSSYKGFNGKLIKWRYEKLQNYFKGKSCLELGSSDGQGTEFLISHFEHVTAVDGSEDAVRELRQRFSKQRNIDFVCSYFEDLQLERNFDTIVMAHILEHVNDPVEVLRKAMAHLSPEGVIIADVPNGNSLHRQVGVKLGMLKKTTQLNEADYSIGHQRVYTPDTFKKDVMRAGLRVETFGGFLIKTISNAQMEQYFKEALNRALFDLGADYPEIAAEMFIIARSEKTSSS